jgi:hypothetical protein
VAGGRQIIYSTAFDHAVDVLGGYRSIDVAIDTIIDALYRNPYGFNKFESDFISFRYAITRLVSAMQSRGQPQHCRRSLSFLRLMAMEM